jgi:hypothetical protein
MEHYGAVRRYGDPSRGGTYGVREYWIQVLDYSDLSDIYIWDFGVFLLAGGRLTPDIH